jgi:hypothetical protein
VIAPGPIGRDQAQRLAQEELSKAIYHQDYSFPQQVLQAISRFLDRLFTISQGAPGGWWTVVSLAALVVIGVAVIAARLGPLARSARQPGLMNDPGTRPLTARQLRDAAEECAASGDFSTAILQRLRAIAAGFEEHGILPPDAGRTADELAVRAGMHFPAHRAGLAAAARLFDQVRYGDGTGTRDEYARLRDLDTTLSQSSPVAAAAGGIVAGARA